MHGWLNGAGESDVRCVGMRRTEPGAAALLPRAKKCVPVSCANIALVLGFLLAIPSGAQTLISGQVHLVGSDLAILSSQDERKEISCTVNPDKPAVGFDLRFHSTYTVNIPLKDLAGPENSLTVLFRVTPTEGGDPSYFVQHFSVPEIAEDAGGEAQLSGSIDLGEGNYHVDWLLRDRTQRVCTHFWDTQATLGGKDKEMQLEIPAGTISETTLEQFGEEPTPVRTLDQTPLKIKILVNFAPQNSLASTMRPQDTSALVSILRRLSREPQFGKFSVVAFNIQEQRVIYRQDAEEHIDFPALGDALHDIKLGTVDAQKLQKKHGDTEFLTELIQTEMTAEDHPDALIFAGPKVMLDASVPEETLKPLAGVDYPVFYMNYTLNPQAVPWRDSISRAVKAFRGTEYTITKPRDMFVSVSEMISRIVKSNYGRSQIKSAVQ